MTIGTVLILAATAVFALRVDCGMYSGKPISSVGAGDCVGVAPGEKAAQFWIVPCVSATADYRVTGFSPYRIEGEDIDERERRISGDCRAQGALVWLSITGLNDTGDSARALCANGIHRWWKAEEYQGPVTVSR